MLSAVSISALSDFTYLLAPNFTGRVLNIIKPGCTLVDLLRLGLIKAKSFTTTFFGSLSLSALSGAMQ